MPSICPLAWMSHPKLPGVEICNLGEALRAGLPQRVLVRLEPRAEIPLHTHTVDAKMLIVAGDGFVLSRDATNGRAVTQGDGVFFERNAPHGFRAGDAGLTFITDNGGIVDERSDDWDISLVPMPA